MAYILDGTAMPRGVDVHSPPPPPPGVDVHPAPPVSNTPLPQGTEAPCYTEPLFHVMCAQEPEEFLDDLMQQDYVWLPPQHVPVSLTPQLLPQQVDLWLPPVLPLYGYPQLPYMPASYVVPPSFGVRMHSILEVICEKIL